MMFYYSLISFTTCVDNLLLFTEVSQIEASGNTKVAQLKF